MNRGVDVCCNVCNVCMHYIKSYIRYVYMYMYSVYVHTVYTNAYVQMPVLLWDVPKDRFTSSVLRMRATLM